MKNYRIEVSKMTQIDNYNSGCIGNHTDYGIIESRYFPDLNDALKFITEDYGVPEIYNNRLELSITENALGDKPSQEHLERWKNGEIELWCADYTFYISEISSLNYENIKNAFPNLNDNT